MYTLISVHWVTHSNINEKADTKMKILTTLSNYVALPDTQTDQFTFFVLDFGLDILNRITGLNLKQNQGLIIFKLPIDTIYWDC